MALSAHPIDSESPDGVLSARGGPPVLAGRQGWDRDAGTGASDATEHSEQRQEMRPLLAVFRAIQAVRSTLTSLVDAFPPYLHIEGRLTAKEHRPSGAYYLLVDTEVVEVDWLTYETLVVGEPLRVRATRTHKAVNIDRLVP